MTYVKLRLVMHTRHLELSTRLEDVETTQIGHQHTRRLEHGMRCWNIGDELLERDAIGEYHVDGQTRVCVRGRTKRSGVARIKNMDTRHVWSQESLRKTLFGPNVIDTSMHTADMGTQ